MDYYNKSDVYRYGATNSFQSSPRPGYMALPIGIYSLVTC